MTPRNEAAAKVLSELTSSEEATMAHAWEELYVEDEDLDFKDEAVDLTLSDDDDGLRDIPLFTDCPPAGGDHDAEASSVEAEGGSAPPHTDNSTDEPPAEDTGSRLPVLSVYFEQLMSASDDSPEQVSSSRIRCDCDPTRVSWAVLSSLLY